VLVFSSILYLVAGLLSSFSNFSFKGIILGRTALFRSSSLSPPFPQSFPPHALPAVRQTDWLMIEESGQFLLRVYLVRHPFLKPPSSLSPSPGFCVGGLTERGLLHFVGACSHLQAASTSLPFFFRGFSIVTDCDEDFSYTVPFIPRRLMWLLLCAGLSPPAFYRISLLLADTPPMVSPCARTFFPRPPAL